MKENIFTLCCGVFAFFVGFLSLLNDVIPKPTALAQAPSEEQKEAYLNHNITFQINGGHKYIGVISGVDDEDGLFKVKTNWMQVKE